MDIDDTKIQEFREMLLAYRAHLNKSLFGIQMEVQAGANGSQAYSQHQADQGTDDFDMDTQLELSSNEMQILRQVERALEKIEEGSYGICDISNKPIPIARLEAVPYATMTVQAQERLEKKQGGLI